VILLAGSGSIKTNRCLLHPKEDIYYFDTEGYNPYTADNGYTHLLVKSALADFFE